MKKLYQIILKPICESSVRHPVLWLLASLLLCLPAIQQINKIQIDTNLIRLLPTDSRAAHWTRQLEGTIGDGGFFTIIMEGDNRDELIQATEQLAAQVKKLDAVQSVEYQYPLKFIEKYRYLLIPVSYLQLIHERIIRWESEVNPFAIDFLESDQDQSYGAKEERKDVDRQIYQYVNLPLYHESPDGKIFGIFIRPKHGVTRLGETKKLFLTLDQMARAVGEQHGLWTGIGGTLRNKLIEYDLIVSDLERSGLITSLAILLVLLLSFRAFGPMPVLILPLSVGLVWSYGLIPWAIGDLNTITSFILIVLFGMGVDYSIHLVKRFQLELQTKQPREALLATYESTGASIIISAVTTVLGLAVLAISSFRGISEFGIIGAGSMSIVLVAMLLVMPATLILGEKLHLLKAPRTVISKGLFPRPWMTITLLVVVCLSIGAAIWNVRFDYDFSNLKTSVPELEEIKSRQSQVYTSSMTPSALYVAPDLKALDQALDELQAKKEAGDLKGGHTTIGRIKSIRDFAPDDADTAERLKWIAKIQERLNSSWTDRVKDENRRKAIVSLRQWRPPEQQPDPAALPEVVKNGLVTYDGSGQYLIGIYPNVERKNGKNAIRFTKEIYNLDMPASVLGPVGETPVFAEILWIVTQEGLWLILLTLVGIAIIIWLSTFSIRDTLWTLLPLVSGLALTLGVMAVTDLKLNFFNMVVLPSLLGMGEDFGVHYYRRWQELNCQTLETHRELFGPLSSCAITTIMGYAGLMFAHHQGLQSIGLLSCVGLTCVWITSLWLFPGILRWREQKRFAVRIGERKNVPQDAQSVKM